MENHKIKSFNFKIALIFGSFLIPLYLSATTDKYRCIINYDPATSMTVAWNQVSGFSPVVYYDTEDRGVKVSNYRYSIRPSKAVKDKGMHNYFARLRNLTPNTRYYFVIVDSEGVSKRMWFKTIPDSKNHRLSIVAGGDSRNFREARRNANLLVAKLRPDVVLFGGDMTGGDNNVQWPQWMNDWQLTIPADGRMTPIVAARGNHEYSNASLIHLFDAPHPSIYYAISFADGLLRTYTLNSLIPSGGMQKEWLQEDLKQHKDVIWKMAQYHFPIRPHTARKAERENQRVDWATLFYKHEVKLVVECDAHMAKSTWPIRPYKGDGSDEGFIRDDINGTVYVGEGGWGAPLRPNDDKKAWTRASGSFNQIKWIFVDASKIEIRTVKTDNAKAVGEVTERFSKPSNLQLWQPESGAVITILHPHPEFVQQALKKKRSSKVRDFNLKLDKKEVAISWKAESEKLGVVYNIESSYDGKKFVHVGKILGLGEKDIQYYTFVDPVNKVLTTNKLYYRLRKVNTEGESSTFRSQAIKISEEVMNKMVAERTSDYYILRYNLPRSCDVVVRILDRNNKEMIWRSYKQQGEGFHSRKIDISSLKEGRYFLEIQYLRQTYRSEIRKR